MLHQVHYGNHGVVAVLLLVVVLLGAQKLRKGLAMVFAIKLCRDSTGTALEVSIALPPPPPLLTKYRIMPLSSPPVSATPTENSAGTGVELAGRTHRPRS